MVFGRLGEDSMWGQAGDDMMFGGADDDRMRGQDGQDTVDGGTGNDWLDGEAGNDMLLGGNGDDILLGGAGDDMADGGNGDDRVVGDDGNDMLFGGNGSDTLLGRQGDDLLVGGDGNDQIVGGAGLDIIGGGAGNDDVFGGEGADEFHFDAGTGTDTIWDFVSGEDVISFLDNGAISFANSATDGVRGSSDLSALDYSERLGIGSIKGADDQKVVELQTAASTVQLMNETSGAAVEAYVVAFDAARGTGSILYDDDWSTAEDREVIAEVTSLTDLTSVQTLNASDFDVY